jgi:hypothetical protein
MQSLVIKTDLMAKMLPNNILKFNGKTVRKLEADDQKIES